MTSLNNELTVSELDEISGALDDNDLEKVTGADKASPKATYPTETISFNYGHIEWTYTQQK